MTGYEAGEIAKDDGASSREVDTSATSGILHSFDKYLALRNSESTDAKAIEQLDNCAHLLRTVAGLLDPRTQDGFYSETTRTHNKAERDAEDGMTASSSSYSTSYFANMLDLDGEQYHPSPADTSLTNFAFGRGQSEELKQLDSTHLEADPVRKAFGSKESSFVENRVHLAKIVLAELNDRKPSEEVRQKSPKCAEIIEQAIELVSKIDWHEAEGRLRDDRQAMFDNLVRACQTVDEETRQLRDGTTYILDGRTFDKKFRRETLSEVRTKLTDKFDAINLPKTDVDRITGYDHRKFLDADVILESLLNTESDSEQVRFGNPPLNNENLVKVNVVSNAGGRLAVEFVAPADHLRIEKVKGQIAPQAEVVKAQEPSVYRLEVITEQLGKQGVHLSVPQGEGEIEPGQYLAEMKIGEKGDWSLFVWTEKYSEELRRELEDKKRMSKEMVKKGGCVIPLTGGKPGRYWKDDTIAISFDKDDNPCGNDEDEDKIAYYRVYIKTKLHPHSNATVYTTSGHHRLNKRFENWDDLVSAVNI